MENRKEIFETMTARLAQVLGRPQSDFSEDTAFADLNMKSVNYSQVTTCLEDAFDVEVPYMDFKRRKTIGEAVDFVVSLLES
jgi:acyl carrier protein